MFNMSLLQPNTYKCILCKFCTTYLTVSLGRFAPTSGSNPRPPTTPLLFINALHSVSLALILFPLSP